MKSKNEEKLKKSKKKCSYSKESLQAAIKELNEGSSLRKVSQKYSIPASTIRSRKLNLHADKKPGPKKILSDDEEKQLVDWITHSHEIGFSVGKFQILSSVQIHLNNLKKKTTFTNNKPGKKWWQGFIKRYPGLTICVLDKVLNRATEDDIKNWFNKLKKFLLSENALEIDSRQVFNSDEILLSLHPKPLTKYQLISNLESTNKGIQNTSEEGVSVLVTSNAAGELAPPFVLFPGEQLPSNLVQFGPKNYAYGVSESGWMTADLFYEYMRNKYIPWIKENKIKLPIIFYMDGRSLLFTLPLTQMCKENQIILIPLYPNAIHSLQPLNVSLFIPLKLEWEKQYKKFIQKYDTKSITKCQVSVQLKKTINNLNLSKIMKKGFKSCGLHPFNVQSIDFLKVLKKVSIWDNLSDSSTDADD